MSDVLKKPVTAGSLVRAFRKRYLLTQKELAEITGLKENNISAIEHDRIEVGLKTAEKLASAFGISPARLLFPNGARVKSKENANIEKRALKYLKTS